LNKLASSRGKNHLYRNDVIANNLSNFFLYTIRENEMFNKSIFGAIPILAILAILTFSWISVTKSSASTSSMNANLTTNDATQAADYRWKARFYKTQNSAQSSTNANLTSYDATEATDYRWNAVANFYENQNAAQSSMNADTASCNPAEAFAYSWNVLVNANIVC